MNTHNEKFVILGEGIFRRIFRYYPTANAAHNDLERCAREEHKQSPLYFSVYRLDDSGELTLA